MLSVAKKRYSFGLTRFFFALLVTGFILTAAGCGTVYKPSPFWGASGYSSKDIDANTVLVNYLTGATADVGTVRDYALYRCAEIALERGYDEFVVLEKGGYSVPGRYGYTTSATVKMRMFKRETNHAADPANARPIYNATALKAQLEPHIRK